MYHVLVCFEDLASLSEVVDPLGGVRPCSLDQSFGRFCEDDPLAATCGHGRL